MANRAASAHLLRRATFAPTAEEVDRAERDGPEAVLARLLRPSGSDPGATGAAAPLDADPYPTLPPGASREQRQRAQQERRRQVRELTLWWLDRMVAAEHQLVEKLVFFWHGHWATSVRKVRSAAAMRGQLDTFYRDGRGDFLVLVRSMLRDPALIVWLDGQRNTARAPNENLARELMELFTLGIGAYTERDVKQGALALTGWTVDRATGAAAFKPRRHATGTQTILGRTADIDVDAYAELLVTQEAHPAFLARRMWQRFAGTDPAPAGVIDRLAAAYRPGRDVTALLRALFTDPAFPGTAGQLVKQPVEWLVGAMRQLGVRPFALADRPRRQLLAGLTALDQVPLAPPSVGGWPAGAAWLTTSSLQGRMRLAEVLAAHAGPAVVARLAAAPAAGRLEALARLLVLDRWTDRTRQALTPLAGEPRRLLSLALTTPEYTVH